MPENRSILYVCEDLDGERNIAFKREQNQTCLNYAERSNEKELNAKRALLYDFTPQKKPTPNNRSGPSVIYFTAFWEYENRPIASLAHTL